MSRLLSFACLALAVTRVSAVVPKWGQCGGESYTGDTTCVEGTICAYISENYSQCVPPENAPPSTTTTTTASLSTALEPRQTTASGLDAHMKAKGKKYWGSCADPNTLNIANNAAILRSDFGQLTPENSMKWDATENTQGVFTFTNADTLANWAVSNGKLIRGHTLIWHSQLPSWVSSITNAATLTSVIRNHISNVAGRYAGKIYAVRTNITFKLWLSCSRLELRSVGCC
ncbi:hypothetical protein H2248_009917 [Termitomyces sp. 'cryptogamus']|nr:hypothetical protein H2248_009917 [Termitomyces sp. 'cryptogamus']